MPSEERGDEVGGAKDIETAGEDGAGDAGEGGAVPGYLRAVDGEVRGDGAVETLAFEDAVGGLLFYCCCCGGSGKRMLGALRRVVP